MWILHVTDNLHRRGGLVFVPPPWISKFKASFRRPYIYLTSLLSIGLLIIYCQLHCLCFPQKHLRISYVLPNTICKSRANFLLCTRWCWCLNNHGTFPNQRAQISNQKEQTFDLWHNWRQIVYLAETVNRPSFYKVKRPH